MKFAPLTLPSLPFLVLQDPAYRATLLSFTHTWIQYAAIREAEALINDLKKIQNPSALTKKVAESRALLSLSATAMVAFGIGIFALVAWAILA